MTHIINLQTKQMCRQLGIFFQNLTKITFFEQFLQVNNIPALKTQSCIAPR